MAKLKWIDWLLALVTAVVLTDIGILQLFNFSLVESVTFGVSWLTKTFYLIGGVVGLISLLRLIMLTLKKV